MKQRRMAQKLLAAAVSMAFLAPAHAVLERAGPVDNRATVGGFPAWFQDKTGLALEFCDLTSQAELDGGWCTLIPPGPIFPESFPDNFFPEHFYYRADTSLTVGTTKARLVLAMEAAFANNDPIPGDQIAFGRERVFITNVPFTGTYTVYYPYGKFVFDDVAAGDRIFFTKDVGLTCVATFECALGTGLGPFLLPSPTPGGIEVPPIPDLVVGQDPAYDALVAAGGTTPYPGNGKKYIADPGRLGPVTGSPLPPFVANDGVTYDHNVFRVEGPNGFVMHTTDFTTNGRLVSGNLAGRVSVDRASYAQTVASATGKKLDVFVTGEPTVPARTPAQPQQTAIVPQLLFFDAPCAGTLNPATGEILPPFSAPAGFAPTQLVSADTKYWAQSQPAAIPTAVCVEDTNSRNLAGQVVPTFYNQAVIDEVTPSGGSGATYSPAGGGTLTLSVKSSDTLAPPVLTAPGYGTLVAGALTVSPLAAPPSTVMITSSEGGVAQLLVQTAVGAAGGGTPIAFNDTLTINEDAPPLVISPLANDTLNGGPIPAGATVAITATPSLGTAVLNANNTITYTPNANANGADSLSYTVTVGGTVSNVGVITVNITPVNDPPVAVNDTYDAVTGRVNRANLIANDTDVDSLTDVVNAQIVTWP
ncbi:MAG TPA: cadherin-like domain-containing protein, partial [Usitatibacter sp.]|nr:cadherin-like domain-containing protein [Usitatibacter sp.]